MDITNFNPENVKDMSYMFANSMLNSIDLSGLKTKNVENMAGMFKGAQALNSLDLSNFDTSNVVDMNSMFEGCISLSSLVLSSKFVTEKVTNMSSMFSECQMLKKIETKTLKPIEL